MIRTQVVLRIAVVAVLAAALLVVLSAISDEREGVDPAFAEEVDPTTVRLAAQRLEDGRTAFALQMRGEDGWGERIKPASNLFWRVEDARVGRWANSSPLDLTSGHTVRISARLLDDGRIEFALQPIIDGEPTERILPRSRKFPANPPVNKWLVSSPIELPQSAAGPPEPTYVPLATYRGSHTEKVGYESNRNDDGSVTSEVYTSSETSDGWSGWFGNGGVLEIWCRNSQDLEIVIEGFEPQDAEAFPVALTIDSVTEPTADWAIGHEYSANVERWSWLEAPDGRALFERLQGATHLSVAIDGIEGTRTWNLTDTFDTLIQGNLSECGNYVEGQVQEALHVFGSTFLQTHFRLRWFRWQDARSTLDTTLLLSDNDVDDAYVLLTMCGGFGAWMMLSGTQFGELSEGDLEVSWSVDGGARRRETWRVTNSGADHAFADHPVNVAHPVNAASVLQAWRQGQELEFTVHTTTPHTERIDLATFFRTPVQYTLDECLATPAPDLSIPAGEIPRTEDGALVYSSGKLFGNHIAASQLSLAMGDTFWSRALLSITCGHEGLGVLVTNVTRGQYPIVPEGQVEAAWYVGSDAPRVTAWDIWEASGFYYVSPQDDGSLYTAIKGGDSLSIGIPTEPVTMLTFDLAGNGFWDTPVQPNLDACAAP